MQLSITSVVVDIDTVSVVLEFMRWGNYSYAAKRSKMPSVSFCFVFLVLR